MEKKHLKFPFWLFESLPKQFCLRGGFDVPYSRFFHESSIQKTFDISIYFHILSIYTMNLGKMLVDSNEWCLLCLCLLLPSGYSEHLDWRWPGRVSPFSSRLIARVREGAIRTRIIRTGCINPCWRLSRRVWQRSRWVKGRAIPPPTTHHKGGFWLLSAFFLLQGADNEGGFWLISAFFLLQGAGD